MDWIWRGKHLGEAQTMHQKTLFFLTAVVLLFIACDTRQPPWNPIFEDTSFRYLDNSIQNALKTLEKAEEQMRRQEPEDAAASLAAARQICLALKNYYIPLTEVRHQIYDADRFYYLKEEDTAKHCLEESRLIIENINQFAEGNAIHTALIDLVSMIDGCILSMNESPGMASEKMKTLGHQVNLMLIKGGLTLKDMTFS